MKRLFTLLAALPLTTLVHGQAITINSTDMPIPTSNYNLIDFTSTAAASPTVGTGSTWDYSAYSGTAVTNSYLPETNTFFTSAGIDVYSRIFKSLTHSAFGYFVYAEYDFNSSNIKVSGTDIDAQAYGLAAFTGSSTDSLIIPAQQILLTSPKVVIQFPCTAGSSWSSVSRRVNNFNLTVGAAGLSNTPSQHTYYVHRTDSVIGWGSMRVYTSSGPSMLYSVLMDKVAEYAVDSFYVGGVPAPTTLLTGLGVAQGQKTDSVFRYNFYRKGSFNYLLSFYYGADATYTTPLNKYMDTGNVAPRNASVNGLQNDNYTTVLFPNPVNGNELNILFSGRNVSDCKYYITDVAGRIMQTGMPENRQDQIHIDLSNNLANGKYVITVTDNENNKISVEQFDINR